MFTKKKYKQLLGKVVFEEPDKLLRQKVFENAYDIYGERLPDIVSDRIEEELKIISEKEQEITFLRAEMLVSASLDAGYPVNVARGVVGSFVAFLLKITDINPLSAHYVCPKCKHTEFYENLTHEYELPEKNCPLCGESYTKMGMSVDEKWLFGKMKYENADIMLDFSGEYQEKLLKSFNCDEFDIQKEPIEDIYEGIDRRLIIGRLLAYYQMQNVDIDIKKLIEVTDKCMYLLSELYYADGEYNVECSHKELYCASIGEYDMTEEMRPVFKEFNYLTSGCFPEIDCMTLVKCLCESTGIDADEIPLCDVKTIKLFNNANTEYVPHYDFGVMKSLLLKLKVEKFEDLVKIYGMWYKDGNKKDDVSKYINKDTMLIALREDIYEYLVNSGITADDAYRIMERVRTGRKPTNEQKKIMNEFGVPKEYIDELNEIIFCTSLKTVLPRVLSAFRIAYYKANYPKEFYEALFKTIANK